MSYYIVFGASSGRAIGHPEQKGLVWQPNPIGVFAAETADEACKAAAKKQERMGTFFAVPGRPWGVSLADTEGITELGAEEDAEDRLNRMMREADERGAKIQALLEKQNNEAYDKVTDDLDKLADDQLPDDE